MPEITSLIGIPPGTRFRLRNLAGAVTTGRVGKTTLTWLCIVNTTGGSDFVQLFDALAADVTPGTTLPDLQFQVGANSALYPVMPLGGILFTTGICAICTTASEGGTGSGAGIHVYGVAV